MTSSIHARQINEELSCDYPITESLPLGRVISRCLKQREEQRYHLYLPKSKNIKACRVFVSVHGISRNAKRHACLFSKYAERYGIILIAPLFDKKHHANYQRFGRSELRSDIALQLICAEVLELTGVDVSQIYMFGYSGGGQFVHRYAMAYPEQVAGIVIGAAGWYTFPDINHVFPYGIRSRKNLPDVCFDPSRFLRVPATVFVGDKDLQRDDALRKSRSIDSQQGETRVTRGLHWVQAMQHAANERGIINRYQFELLKDVDHSFSRCVKRANMCQKVFQSLFGGECSAVC